MIQPATLRFLKNLEKNNNKTWFDANRKEYEAAKSDFLLTVEQLLEAISKFDPSISHLTAKECVFRINRDVRFSKDKSPYKTNFGASISKGGKKIGDAGYYFHADPGKSFVGGGIYMPMPPDLAKIRQEIDYNFDEWEKIIKGKNFKRYFPEGIEGIEILSRPPKGYAEDNLAIEFLKMKCFIVSRVVSDEELQAKNFVKEAAKTFEAMKPLVDFLNRAND